jgi:hypothetical protein
MTVRRFKDVWENAWLLVNGTTDKASKTDKYLTMNINSV